MASENMNAMTLAAIDHFLSRSDKVKIAYECDLPQADIAAPKDSSEQYFACIVCHEDTAKTADAYPSGKMAKFVDELRNRIRLADSHGLQREKHFDWLTYSDNKISETATTSSGKSGPTRSKTDSITTSWDSISKSDPELLPYTALLQRSSTMKSTKVNGYGDLSKRLTERRDSFEVKKAWLSARMRDREDEFVDWHDISVFAGTWNVHGSTPDESLAPWLLGNATEDEKAIEPDMYIVGLQEMDLSTEAYLVYDPARENAWCEAVMQGLGNRAQKYTKLASQQLVSMLIIVLVKESLAPHISEVSTTYTGVGLMGIMGNKGCVSVRFRLYDSYLCAVSSHLAAFMNQVERRNQDYAEICKRLAFPNVLDESTSYATSLWNDGGDEGVIFIESNGVTRDWSQQNSIFHSDHLIWVGDLNYRINLTEAEVKAALRKRDLKSLIEYDQLTIEREGGRTFHFFDEGDIDFLPTYKYDAGTNRYDTSEKRRAPAWTDRVLWRKARAHLQLPGKNGHHSDIQLTSYASCMDMMMSDHKPVNAVMRLKARQIDAQRQATVKADIVKIVSANRDDRPDARISNSFVEFGDVRFMTQKEVSITLENTGQMVASWRFIPKFNEPAICKPWLDISNMAGVLGPGEQTVIDFRILIDTSTASSFNNDQDQIADMLILSLENCKDFFLVISGNYIPTCFGMSLEKLARLKGPVHSASKKGAEKEADTRSSSPETSQNGTMPKEIWRMLNFLWNKSMLELDKLFLESGNLLLAQYIQKCLDTGDEFDNSILLGAEEPNKEVPSSSTATLNATDSSPLARRKSLEYEAISSLNQPDTTNAVEEQISNINDNDDIESDNVIVAISATTGANSMVDVLVAFLESLPESVIPSSLYKRLIDGTLSPNANQLKEYMSPVHHNVLIYMIDFLRDAIKYCPSSFVESRTQRIVAIFAAALVRPPTTYNDRNPKLTWRKRQQVMKHLLA
ncbi:hypothetical protein Unana1_03389 [Umbelopsis nana]